MAHLRRVGGRFVTHDAHSIYTRALVAPSETWTKQWVTPAGVPVGSKYKVLKWVLSEEKQEFSDEDSDDEEIEGFEDNHAPTLVLPSAPPPPPQAIKPEPSPVPEVVTSTSTPAPIVVVAEEAPTPIESTSSLAPPPPSAPAVVEALTSSMDMVVDSPAPAAAPAAGEASVLPSGEMALTSEDGADPAGEGRRIAEAGLQGPPEDGTGTGTVELGLEEEVVVAPVAAVEPVSEPEVVAAAEPVAVVEEGVVPMVE